MKISREWVSFTAIFAALLLLTPDRMSAQELGRWWSGGPYSGSNIRVAIGAQGGGEILFAASDDLLKSRDMGSTWKGSGLSGVRLVACDPTGSVVYVVAYAETGENRARMYRSSDSGETWQLTALAVESIFALAIHPEDPNTVLVGLMDPWPRSYLRRSTDGGDTWEDLPLNVLWSDLSSIVFVPKDPLKVFACSGGSTGGIMRSLDGGESWATVDPSDEIEYLWADPGKAQVVYAFGHHSGLKRSVDGGTTWSPLHLPKPSTQVVSICLSPIKSGLFYVGFLDGTLYRSQNDLRRWVLASQNPSAISAIFPSPANRGRAYFQTGILAISTNKGASMKTTSLSAGSALSLAAVVSGGSTLYAGSGGAIFKSEDGGETWRRGAQPFQSGVEKVAAHPATPDTVFALGGYEVSRTKDGGRKWKALRGGLPENTLRRAIAIDPQDFRKVYLGAGNGIYRSSDGGDTWAELPIRQSVPSVLSAPIVLESDASIPGKLYAVIPNTGLLVTEDGGGTWRLLDGDSTHFNAAIATCPGRPGLVYAGGFSGVKKSLDGGVTWVPAGLADADVRCLLADPAVPSRLFAGISSEFYHHPYGVYVSEDEGVTWNPLGSQLAGCEVSALEFDALNPKVLHAALRYRSSASGAGFIQSFILDP